MNDKQAKRRRRSADFQAESLETRALLTSGAGNNFAILQANVEKTNVATTIPFTVTPTQFTRPNGKITIGIDVAQKGTSTVKPFIFKITDAEGHVVPFTRGAYSPKIERAKIINGNVTTAVTATLRVPKNALSAPQSYNVQIQGQNGTTGQFLVGFYLPGDAKGTGVVDNAALDSIRKAMGSSAGGAKYDFNFDGNRDGVINRADLTIAQRNVGAKTTVTPVVSANLDAASDIGLQDRITSVPNAKFTGNATPDAVVTYKNTSASQPDVVVKADEKGEYVVTAPLAMGDNVFQVTTVDAFGQTISGQIAAVTRRDTVPPAIG